MTYTLLYSSFANERTNESFFRVIDAL